MAPYRVLFEKKTVENNLNLPITKFNVGKDLKNNNFNKCVTNILKISRNKAVVFVDNINSANSIIDNSSLKSIYNVSVPKYFVSVSGVIAGIPTDINEEDILDDIYSPNHEILAVQRLKRRINGELVDSMRIKVVFRTNKLPESVRLFCTVSKVRPFFRRISFCNNCLKYNHQESYCRSIKRCQNCTKVNCTGCQSPPKCLYCGLGHKSSDENCTERENQKKINNLMAVNNLIYQEARQNVIFGSNRFDLLAQLNEFDNDLSVKPSQNLQTFANTVKNSLQIPKKNRSRSHSQKRTANPVIETTSSNSNIEKSFKRNRTDTNNEILITVEEPMDISQKSDMTRNMENVDKKTREDRRRLIEQLRQKIVEKNNEKSCIDRQRNNDTLTQEEYELKVAPVLDELLTARMELKNMGITEEPDSSGSSSNQ